MILRFKIKDEFVVAPPSGIIEIILLYFVFPILG